MKFTQNKTKFLILPILIIVVGIVMSGVMIYIASLVALYTIFICRTLSEEIENMKDEKYEPKGKLHIHNQISFVVKMLVKISLIVFIL